MKILAAGDSFMPPRYFEQGFAALGQAHDVEYFQIDDQRHFEPTSESELRLSEYQGTPEELAERMGGIEVLAVQGAPVTDAVLDASSDLKLVCCARGGPVNIDVAAVTARRLPLVNTPGKNAEAVADQTLAFLVMLARGFPKAQRFLDEGNQLRDNWEGAKFIGSDLRRHTLGLVGYGNIGHRVALRAAAFGMTVLAYDPYLECGMHERRRARTVARQAARAVRLRLATRPRHEGQREPFRFGDVRKDAPRLVLRQYRARDARRRGCARRRARHRDSLRAPRSTSSIQCETPGRHRLLRHENVVMTPHIGGATRETLLQGAEMIADEILRFAAGAPLVERRQS